MVERSGTGRVMPGNWVFPGGNADPSDADFKWIPLFKDVQKIDILNGQFFEDGAKIPEIYATADNSEQIIPKEITLRITAVRELFEEAGILLCKPRTVDPVKHIQDGMLHYEFPELENKEKLQEWQKRVRKDSTSFLQLCKLLDCVPDINALYDWSNWLTPTTFKPKSRFDTMYYMVILPRMPRVVIDGNEAVKAQVNENSIKSCFIIITSKWVLFDILSLYVIYLLSGRPLPQFLRITAMVEQSLCHLNYMNLQD